MRKSSKRKKTVWIFAAASFLNDLGSDMIYPIWPLFVTTFLGVDMAVLGLIDGLGDAIVSISQAFSGYLSDRLRKRKIFIWLGYLFGGLSRMGYALSSVWQWLIPFKILDRAGKMRGAPRNAFVADLSNNKNRGTNFGILRLMDNFGAFIGILITIFFFSYLGFKKLFLIAAIPSFIGAILIILFIKEKKLPGVKLYKGVNFKDFDKNFIIFLVLSGIFAFGAFSYSFLLVFANAAGFKIYTIPILYLIFTFFAAISALPFGKLADIIGRRIILALSFLLWILVSVFLILSNSAYWMIGLSFVFFGLHRGALEPVQGAFVAELAPKKFKASGIGAYKMVVGLLALPASLMAGLLWDNINMFVPFYLSIALTTIALLLLLFVKERK